MDMTLQHDMQQQAALATQFAGKRRYSTEPRVKLETVSIETVHTSDGYTPNNLLDSLRVHFEARNDAHLANMLQITPPIISKLRNGAPLTAGLLIRMHDRTGIPIEKLRELAGLKPPVEMQRVPFAGGVTGED